MWKRSSAMVTSLATATGLMLAVTPAVSAQEAEQSQSSSIGDIQGTGKSSPMVGKQVVTHGWVTASYPQGGLNGFFIQEGGGASAQKPGEASRGIFVYTGHGSTPPQTGICVKVSGTVGEYKNSTQLADVQVEESNDSQSDCGDQPKPIDESIPADPVAREANEGMLFQPSGGYTVTNNYDLNSFGSVDLVEGDEPLYQATSVVRPGAEALAYEAKNAQRAITLDDGATVNYFRNDEAKDQPLPYLAAADGIRSLRAGDAVTFRQPVVLSYNFGKWGLQPTSQITGKIERDELPIAWEDSRPAEVDGPQPTGGTHSIASFNVLNYFTRLGQEEDGCEAYTDRDDNPITSRDCRVRGAFTDAALADQQAKIVKAINTLDVSVLGLEEIENSASFGGNRDEALKHLVGALNAAGGHWEYVPSPQEVPENEDVIRTGFIYNPDAVESVGESRILDHEAFDEIARQPLAQQFRAVGGEQSFVAVVNHYKSKGSVARGDADMGDGQGNNANLRRDMSKALAQWLGEQTDWKELPQFVMGDFNAYAKEDAMTELEGAGFSNLEAHYKAGHSYQFGGRVGSLDHVMANAAAMKMTTGADVWDINADESNSFEYSRRNYNVTDFYAPDVFRSSDHDPIRVGFTLDGEGEQPEQPGEDGSSLGSADFGSLAGSLR